MKRKNILLFKRQNRVDMMERFAHEDIEWPFRFGLIFGGFF